MYKTLWIFLCILGFLINDSQEQRGSPWRGRRRSKSGEIPLGLGIGWVCKGRDKMSRLQACYKAKQILEMQYGVVFNKVRCAKNIDTKFRTQCHLKMKKRKTTDFECYVYNTNDMSGAAVARCRAPFGKPLAQNQQMAQSMGGGMGMMGGPMGGGMGMMGGGMGGPMGGGMGGPMGGGMGGPMGGMSPYGMGMPSGSPYGMGMQQGSPYGMGGMGGMG